jgi:integrase
MRQKNEGTIYEYPEGSGIWWAQLAEDEFGKRPKRRASSAAEALKLLREMEKEREQGVSLTTKRPTTAQLLDLWLDQVVRRKVKATTLAEYRKQVKYLTDRISERRVNRLTAPLIQATLNTLADDVSVHIAYQCYLHIRAALRTAVRWRYISHNVALDVEPPRAKTAEHEPPDPATVRRILAVLHEYHRAFFQVIATLGIRHSEACGLLWRDLNWDAATLKITQQVVRLDGKLQMLPPKTESSVRLLPVPPAMLALLRAVWEAQQALRRELGPRWKEHGLIFPKQKDGTPQEQSNTRLIWNAACKRAEVPHVRVHDLRHFTATQIGEAGTPEHIIGAILGHTKATTTRKYTHATLAAMRQALEQLERLLDRRAA